jgi:hypothetical protein
MKNLRYIALSLIATLAILGMAQYSSDEALAGIWGVVQNLVPFHMR